MANPIFPFLKVTFQAYNYMEGLFRKGWAANAVQTFMSGIGMGYRRSTVQAVRRKVLGVLKFESYYRILSEDKRPSVFRIPDLSWERHDKYKIMYTKTIMDPETGELHTELGSHYDNNYLTKGEYKQLIEDEIDPEKYIPGGILVDVTVTQVIHKQGVGY